jgi:branched-chain amino acid transport system permease protein
MTGSIVAGLRKRFVRFWPLLVLLALVSLVAQVRLLGGEVLERQVIQALINLTLVVGLYTFIGNSGVFSFGHISFMAVGAYTTALLVIPPESKTAVMSQLPDVIERAHWSSPAAIAFGGALAAVFALVLSIPLMRLSGIGATLATFAVLIIVYVVADNWTKVTNGSSGIAGIPFGTTIWVGLAWSLAAMTAAYLFQISRYGLRLRASREDEGAARSIGVGVHGERRIAFVISGFFTGIGGGLFAQFIGSFNAQSFYFTITFLTVVMLVVGGITSLAGAVIGTIFISIVSEVLLQLEDGFDVASAHVPGRPGLREVILAFIMLSILVLRPRGITAGREISWPFSSGGSAGFPRRGRRRASGRGEPRIEATEEAR